MAVEKLGAKTGGYHRIYAEIRLWRICNANQITILCPSGEPVNSVAGSLLRWFPRLLPVVCS